MWDPPLAAEEMERCAAKGATAFCFSENPAPLGLPTIHDPDRLLGPGDGGGQRPRDGRVHARRLVVAACRTIAPDAPVHGQPRLGREPHVGHDALVAVQRHVHPLPEPQDRAVGRRDRLDPVLPRAGRAGARQAALLGAARACSSWTHADAPTSTSTPSTSASCSATTSSAASSTTRTASRASTRSARTTSCARPTTRTPTRRGPTASAWSRSLVEHLPGRGAVQDPAGQRRAAVPVHARRAAGARQCLTPSAPRDRGRPRAVHGQRDVHRVRAEHVRARRRDEGDRRSTRPGDAIEAVRIAVEACPTGALRSCPTTRRTERRCCSKASRRSSRGRARASGAPRRCASPRKAPRSSSPTSTSTRAKETVRQVEAAGGTAVAVECDVSQEAEVADMIAAAVEHFGRLDILFNNVGIPTPRLGHDLRGAHRRRLRPARRGEPPRRVPRLQARGHPVQAAG